MTEKTERKAANGAAARITEEELREVEARTADPPLAGDGPALRRLAAEVRALQAERDDAAAALAQERNDGDGLRAEIERRRVELALMRREAWKAVARPAPADASEEARAIVLDSHLPNIVSFAAPLTPGARITSQELLVLHVVSLEAMLHGRPVFAALHEKDRQGRMLTMFVCDGDQRPWRTADASRPGSAPFVPTEEQALHSAPCVALYRCGATERQAIDFFYEQSKELFGLLIKAKENEAHPLRIVMRDASRPGLTEEQARAWAESIGDMIETHGLEISIIAAALLRASRGEIGGTK